MTDDKTPNCHNCWWADFDESAPSKHLIVTEPDMLTMQNMNDEPKEIRVVQTCFKKMGYFKSYGAMSHDCKGFEHSEARQAELDKEIEAKRKAWTSPTVRYRLPSTTNLFKHFEVMSEENNTAYDVLIDGMTMHPATLSGMILDLDDMNIRGEQIVLAHSFCDDDVNRLAETAKRRDLAMVEYINKAWSRSGIERAVQRGAHLYGHAAPIRPRPKPVVQMDGEPVRRRPPGKLH